MRVTNRNSAARPFVLTTLIALVISFVGLLQAATEKEAIIIATKQYVAAHSQVSGFHVSIEKIEGDYARVKVTPKNPRETDAAWVFLKREKGVWRGLMIGTGFESEDYDKFHIPAGIQL